MNESLLPFPKDPRWQRSLSLAVFLGGLYLLRHLALVAIFFVVFQRALGFLVDQTKRRSGWSNGKSLIAVLATLSAALAGVCFWGARQAWRGWKALRHLRPEVVKEWAEHPAVHKAKHALGVDGEKIVKTLEHHALSALKVATKTAHGAVYIMIGLLLAVLYLADKERVDGFLGELSPTSLAGTLARWTGYTFDAIFVTARLQVVVAVVNAVVTLPVLFALGFPHKLSLFCLILFSGLVPVVGNLVSGAVLAAVAYGTKGTWAVVVFLLVTALLHKLESYYLNPKLASAHVKLPGLILVVSLLVFEQLFGFRGLFLSFPSLYVALRMLHEWKETQEAAVAEGAAV